MKLLGKSKLFKSFQASVVILLSVFVFSENFVLFLLYFSSFYIPFSPLSLW